MIRKFSKLWPVALLLLMAGCTVNNKDGTLKEINRQSGIWDRFFVGPLSDFLKYIGDLTGGAYGISILVVTIIVRFVVLPLTLKQYKSSKAMQALQPELAKIKEKYKDEPQKQQEETMKLFTQNKVNPMAGCFPLLIQMPVLMALYNAIYRTPEIREHAFLGIQLGSPDHYILPIVAALTTFLQTKLMPKQQTQQMGAMQTIMLIYPVMIFFIAQTMPAALPLYWIFSNLFTIIQNFFIYRDKPGVAVVTAGDTAAVNAVSKKKSGSASGSVKNGNVKNAPKNAGKSAGKTAKKPSK
ncbi:membrane protein insertase YidC [Gorillibacterium sp. sgz500922]|uniref:YidC/Oxa1 family membrane protein insertase n=1 Tax=Gorillibacterium sp. sgz500922 TaxID=3446694 RepID=UPI003F678B44